MSGKSTGISFLGALAIVFITLKLMKYIDWSWWYVLMPLYLPITIAITVVVVVCTVGGLFIFCLTIYEKIKSS